jgi:hypothetical protein
MTTFFIDLWNDLRERRLWPVAVGLLAAIVAVPVVLFKPASDAAPQTTVAPHPNAANTLPVVSVDSGPTVGSKLEAFNQKNPFKPMKDLADANKASAPKSPAGGTPPGGGGGGGGTPPTGAPGVPGGAPGNSGTPGAPGGSGGTPPGVDPNGPHVQWFRYAADFTFGEAGHPKKFDGPESYTLLPDEKNPAIVFIGVSDDGKSAVFLISDPGFQAEGEGHCAPAGKDCQFVTLSLKESSNEETFTALDGSLSYDVKLKAIRREKLETDANGNPAAPASSKTDSSKGKVLGDTSTGVNAATEATQSVIPDIVVSGPGIAREQR